MAALPGLETLAHGGIPGLIAETSIGLVIVLGLGTMWLRERRRRARRPRPPASMRDE